MDKQSTVVFRNVGQMYFPQTRVECHYSLTSEHQWSSSDWIGIFETGWSSLKQYHTYTWALVPEGYTEGTGVDGCAGFQASYLPRPSAAEYQFVYVDKTGNVCARSRSFTFCAPKPLEELEMLKEVQDEEDGGEELLLVIPRAQLLQADKKKIQDLSHELQKKEEWLQEERIERDVLEAELGKEKVLLSDAKRELQDLMAALRKLQKEREEEQLHTQNLLNYIHQLEQKSEILAETKSNSISAHPSSEKDEDAPVASSRSVSSPLFLSAHLEDRCEIPSQSGGDEPALDSQDETTQINKNPARDGKQLILPEPVSPVLSELADSPMW